jgi:hypothetical protein
MRRNGRERLVARARRLLTDKRVALILRAMLEEMADQRVPQGAWPDMAGAVAGPPYAVPLINKCLDGGESLDQIFYTGKHRGFYLEAKPSSGAKLTIEFGCVTGPDDDESAPSVGDGGTWIVELDDAGGVRSVKRTGIILID